MSEIWQHHPLVNLTDSLNTVPQRRCWRCRVQASKNGESQLAKSSLKQLSRVKAPQWQINCTDKCAGRPLHPAEMDLMVRRSRRLHLTQLTWRRLSKVCVYVPTSFKFTCIYFPERMKLRQQSKVKRRTKTWDFSQTSLWALSPLEPLINYWE